MSFYSLRGSISSGYHEYELENEDGYVIASGEGICFEDAIADLRSKLPPSRREYGDDFWIHPLDEVVGDYQ